MVIIQINVVECSTYPETFIQTMVTHRFHNVPLSLSHCPVAVLINTFQWFECEPKNWTYSVSYTGNRHSIPVVRAPAVNMIGWHGMAPGCRRQGPAGYRPPSLQIKMASTF